MTKKKTTRPTPVISAVLAKDVDALRSILERGGDVGERDRDGRTALHHAAIEGDDALVAALLEAGAPASTADRDGWTPLHFAAQGFHVDVARLLLNAGAQVDAPDAHGNTPLFRAVFESRGRGELIMQLLAAGADRTHRNNHGVSPAELAESIANFDVNQWLR